MSFNNRPLVPPPRNCPRHVPLPTSDEFLAQTDFVGEVVKRHLVVGLILLLQCYASTALAAARVGVGFSTVTSGRQIPAIEVGLGINDWSASAMLAGARTKAYYTSGVLVNVLKTKDWGKFWFGRLEVGGGGGAFHGEKGIYTEVDENGELSGLKKDTDNVVGPAFRVAFKPFEHFHISLEYMMGFGTSVISNAWEDVGMGAIGVDL